MNKKLVLLNIVLIAGLLLAACGPNPSTVTIQIPGTEDQNNAPAQGNMNTILVYILMGALVVITLVALLGRRGSQ